MLFSFSQMGFILELGVMMVAADSLTLVLAMSCSSIETAAAHMPYLVLLIMSLLSLSHILGVSCLLVTQMVTVMPGTHFWLR
jgi:hypothetical protein